MKYIILLIFLFGFSAANAADSGDKKTKRFAVAGQVVDGNENLAGVQVKLDGAEYFIYTDLEGRFIIPDVSAGKHTLTFSLITYQDKSVTFDLSNGSNLQIELHSK